MAAKLPITTNQLVESLKLQAAIAREERAKANALFLSIGEGVIATDEAGIIIRVNQRALDILGYDRHELIGKWFPKKIRAVTEAGMLIQNIERPMTKAFVGGEIVSERTYYQCKDGSIIPVQLNVSPIMMHNRPTGAIEIFRDITFENEMDKLKADFISLASHQLRTPLAAVQTYTNMFLQGYVGDVTDVQQSFLKTILKASERMNELISTLLNITRIEAGNLLVHSSPVVLNSLIDDLQTELAPMADDKAISISVNPTSEPITTKSDPALIHEVLVNLLINAIKYTGEGGAITISLQTEGRQALISVSDTGYGIPANDQSHIFTKFYRASNILKRDTTGTGLGLYLVKNIAERLGGELWFTSREDHGTTFYFTLPIMTTQPVAKIKL